MAMNRFNAAVVEKESVRCFLNYTGKSTSGGMETIRFLSLARSFASAPSAPEAANSSAITINSLRMVGDYGEDDTITVRCFSYNGDSPFICKNQKIYENKIILDETTPIYLDAEGWGIDNNPAGIYQIGYIFNEGKADAAGYVTNRTDRHLLCEYTYYGGSGQFPMDSDGKSDTINEPFRRMGRVQFSPATSAIRNYRSPYMVLNAGSYHLDSALSLNSGPGERDIGRGTNIIKAFTNHYDEMNYSGTPQTDWGWKITTGINNSTSTSLITPNNGPLTWDKGEATITISANSSIPDGEIFPFYFTKRHGTGDQVNWAPANGNATGQFVMNNPPELYSFTSFTFTTGGNTGPTGPTLSGLTSGGSGSYNTSTYPWLTNINYFGVNLGYQIWTIPATGTYRITCAGAISTTRRTSGRGRILRGDFSLTEGNKLCIVVGQQENNIRNIPPTGGGGGSFVVNQYSPLSSTPESDILIIAGGGGGSHNSYQADLQASQADGRSGTSGGAGYPSGSSGGTNGGGGGHPGGSTGSSAGAGFLYNGNGRTMYPSPDGNLPKSYRQGLIGGGYNGSSSNQGGFGGGGFTWYSSGWGGGGGGYSGGGTTSNSSYYGFAGGGGSKNNGTNTADLGLNSSDGYVTIEQL